MEDLQKWEKLSPQEIQQIIVNYRDLKMNLKESGKAFGLNGLQVRNLLKINKIPQRRQAKDNRKFKVNDKFFSTESPDMAYILGFWAADGNVHSTENRLDLELASVDREILEKINIVLDNERPIKTYTCANGYVKNKLYFWSKEIKDTFREYGIVPNKTYSKDFSFPFKLSEEYVIDYIRGFFDGNGCVKKTNSLTFELNSLNKKFLEDISIFLKEKYNIITKITTCGLRSKEQYRLYCYGEEAKKVFNVLYTKDSLYLTRKYNKWLELLQ